MRIVSVVVPLFIRVWREFSEEQDLMLVAKRSTTSHYLSWSSVLPGLPVPRAREMEMSDVRVRY